MTVAVPEIAREGRDVDAAPIPDVTVLTPSMNYARFIQDALQSVHQQTRVTISHVVQDGGSSDGTAELLAQSSIESLDWRSERDQGQSDALNRALQRATGRWIGWLNADEFYLPSALETLVAAGEKYDADVVFGDAVFVNEQGRVIRLVPQHRFSRFLLRWYGCFIPSCGILFRHDSLHRNPWDTSLSLAMDWDLYLRLAEKRARFIYVPRPVAAFRIHEAQVVARPVEQFRSDFAHLAYRHGVPRMSVRKVVRFAHDLYKLLDGSYQRQLRARRFAHADIRWFSSPIAMNTCNSFLASCTRKERAESPIPAGSDGARV